jgi:hypothetical protein
VSAGKYLEGAGTSGLYVDSNPASRLVRTTTRGWSDFDVNFVPNCVLTNPLANGECGAINSTFFGQLAGPTVDPSLLSGSGVRPSDWSVAASVERRFLTQASVAVEYFRRWYDGFTVVDNVLVGPADFQAVNITVPSSQTLPAGGQTVGPLYIQNQASFTRFQPVIMPAERYGNQTLQSDSVDVVFNGHTGFGLTFQGGSSTTRVASDSCDIRAAVPESAPLNPYCRVRSGALTQFRGLATYTVPNIGVQIGAVYQNKPGPPIVANGNVFVGVFPFAFLSVNLVEPGTLYGERISQLDLRAVKELRIARMRILAGIDLYNAFNSSDVLSYTQVYSSFLTARPVFPTSVVAPRLLRVTADVRF